MKRMEQIPILQRGSNKTYDIGWLSTKFKNSYNEISYYESINITYETHRIAPLLYELLDRDIWRLRGGEVIKRHIGYSVQDKSLTVALYDKDDLRTICIRHSTDKSGQRIKWKTLGSKNFIPHKIFDEKDPTIFVASGIGEFLLFELLEMNYLVVQSDSISLENDHNEFVPVIQDRIVVVLLDNDRSCERFYERVEKAYKKSNTYVLPIRFPAIFDKPVPPKYDFRDFCNEIAKEVRGNDFLCSPEKIKNKIFETLLHSIETEISRKQPKGGNHVETV